jgi:hypothetical protein
MVWWGDIFFSSFLATPLVAERSKDSKRWLNFYFFPRYARVTTSPLTPASPCLSFFFKGSEGVIIQFYADETPLLYTTPNDTPLMCLNPTTN